MEVRQPRGPGPWANSPPAPALGDVLEAAGRNCAFASRPAHPQQLGTFSAGRARRAPRACLSCGGAIVKPLSGSQCYLFPTLEKLHVVINLISRFLRRGARGGHETGSLSGL